MSKIEELYKDNRTLYFFDVDGVLAPIDYGEYNHYTLNDDEWATAVKEKNFYKNRKPFKVFQKFIANKDINKVYVITKVMNEEESTQKKDFLNYNYGILKENIYFVFDNKEKLEKIIEVKNNYSELEDKYFVMIDDTTAVLDYIKENSSFSTVHVSSFLE